jgi:hypothetical protein
MIHNHAKVFGRYVCGSVQALKPTGQAYRRS